MSIESYYLSKNKKEYGSVALLNKETSVSSLKDCIIHTVYYTIYVDGVSEEETIERSVILINGIDYKGYTSDQVEEAMNGTELIDKSEKTLIYQDGDFITTFSIGDRGTVSSVKLKMDIETKFVIE